MSDSATAALTTPTPAAASTLAAASTIATSSSSSSLALPARAADVLPVYVDYNATTPLSEAVVAAMLPFLTAGVQSSTLFGNASSGHVYGASAKAALERARASVARAINAESPQEIVFLSGATESLNYALQGAAFAQRARGHGHHLITANVEHIAALQIFQKLQQEDGFDVTILPVDSFGRVSARQVAEALRPTTVLVSLMLANNEVGALMPLQSIVAAVRSSEVARHVWIHTDASQALGKVAVDVQALGVDLLTVAGHKVYASKGVGALYIRASTIGAQGGLRKFMVGANHESDRRAGTENVMLCAGLGAACDEFATPQLLQDIVSKFVHLRDTLQRAIQQRLDRNIRAHGLGHLYSCSTQDENNEQRGQAAAAPSAALTSAASAVSAAAAAAPASAPSASRPRVGFLVHAPPVDRLSNTLSIGFVGLSASELLDRLRFHLSASAGSACHASTVHLSYVLQAMGVAREYAMGTVRLSVGRYNSSVEMEQVGEWIANTVTQMWIEQKQADEQAAAAGADALLSPLSVDAPSS